MLWAKVVMLIRILTDQTKNSCNLSYLLQEVEQAWVHRLPVSQQLKCRSLVSHNHLQLVLRELVKLLTTHLVNKIYISMAEHLQPQLEVSSGR